MTAPVPDIATARFRLRPLRPEDASERYSRWLDGDGARAIEASRAPHGVAQLQDYIRARTGRPDVLFLGIFARDDGSHVGNVKYEPVDEARGFAVMGILVGEAGWRGRGVAAEVIEASARWLHANRGVREIVLGVEQDHASAIRAYEKLGFRIENTDRIPAKAGALAMVWHLAAAA